jgi:hypothetical protein
MGIGPGHLQPTRRTAMATRKKKRTPPRNKDGTFRKRKKAR